MIDSGYRGLIYGYIPICDGCYDEAESEESFEDAVQAIRDYGWQTIRNEEDTDWLNYCPDCEIALSEGDSILLLI